MGRSTVYKLEPLRCIRETILSIRDNVLYSEDDGTECFLPESSADLKPVRRVFAGPNILLTPNTFLNVISFPIRCFLLPQG